MTQIQTETTNADKKVDDLSKVIGITNVDGETDDPGIATNTLNIDGKANKPAINTDIAITNKKVDNLSTSINYRYK